AGELRLNCGSNFLVGVGLKKSLVWIWIVSRYVLDRYPSEESADPLLCFGICVAAVSVT
ncbi:hypothetical protein NDU88_001669, partial [Pleurodeles waltl]